MNLCHLVLKHIRGFQGCPPPSEATDSPGFPEVQYPTKKDHPLLAQSVR